MIFHLKDDKVSDIDISVSNVTRRYPVNVRFCDKHGQGRGKSPIY